MLFFPFLISTYNATWLPLVILSFFSALLTICLYSSATEATKLNATHQNYIRNAVTHVSHNVMILCLQIKARINFHAFQWSISQIISIDDLGTLRREEWKLMTQAEILKEMKPLQQLIQNLFLVLWLVWLSGLSEPKGH